jgi:hypothetical protein
LKLRFFILIFCLASISYAQEPWATGQSKAEDIRIKLVTFGPGDDIPSWWGHGGIIVEDLGNQRSRIYNFGLYSFDKGMLTKFAMGRLIFSVGDFSVPGYLYYYKKLNRDVTIQTLDLSPQKSLQVAKLLARNVLPQNREYLYHHYYDNCSTRLRDVINAAVNNALYRATDQPAPMTLRDETRRYVGHNFFMEMLLMYLMNDEIDKPIMVWDEMFLPDELEKQVAKLKIPEEDGSMKPLVSDTYVFYKSDRHQVYDKVPVHWPLAVFWGIVIGLTAVAIALWFKNTTSPWVRIIYGIYISALGLLIGIPGLILALLASFTDHTVTYYNENLIFINPLTFMFIITGVAIARNKNWGWIWSDRLWWIHMFLLIAAIALKLLPSFDQDNLLIISFAAPLFVFNLIASRLLPKSIKK